MHFLMLPDLTHGDTKALVLSTEMKVAGASASFFLLFSIKSLPFTPNVFPFTWFVNNVKAQIMMSHSLLGALYAVNITCSFAVSPISSMSKRLGIRQSNGIPHTPHHRPLMSFFFFFSP